MKSTATQNNQNTPVQPKPFFNKGAEGSFFSGSDQKQSFFNSSSIQASMTVGQPDDPYEQEAENVSRQVVDGFDQASSIQRKLTGLGLQPFTIQPFTIGSRISRKLQKTISRTPLSVQSKCDQCEEEEKMQKKSEAIQFAGEGSAVSPAIESKIQSMRGSGQAMDIVTQAAMESSFGADFSNVRLHTNSEAAQMSRDLNAHAFTVGSDIFFNEGGYQPHTKQGAGLLAHELTHTVQQGASVQNKSINRHPYLSSLSSHAVAHLSAMNGGSSALSRQEIAQLQSMPEMKMQQQKLQMKEVDKVQKKGNVGIMRSCFGSTPTVTPTPPVFTVTSFTTSGSGNAILAENGGLQVSSQPFLSNAKVKATGDNAEIANWEIGYIQTLYTASLESEYERTFDRWSYTTLPIRDGFTKTNVPWYNTHTTATTSGTEISESIGDQPRHTTSWNDPRIANPNSLQKYKRDMGFGAWLIARRNTGEITYLKNIQWGFDYIVDVDKTKAIGSRATNSGTGMRAIASGNGQGAQTPVLTAPIANDAVKNTIVAK